MGCENRKRFSRGLLVAALLAVPSAAPAHASPFLSKATALRIQEPLTVAKALRVAAVHGGYGEVFLIERISPRAIRLRVCDRWFDIYVNDAIVDRACGRLATVIVKQRKGRVRVLKRGHALPSPD